MSSESGTYADLPNNTDKSWWKDPGLRKNVFHIAGLCVCPFYLGYDSALLTGLQALPYWKDYFGHPTGTTLGLITASISFPTVITSFFASWVAEKYGRRWAVWIGTALIIVGGIVNGLANSLAMLIIARVIIGAGGGMTKVVAVALLHEIAHPRLRPLAASIFYSLYYSGSILAAWLTFGTLYIKSDWSWRFPALVQVLGPVIVLSMTITMPESPRWLVKSDQAAKALDILANYHANGDSLDPLVQYEYREIVDAIEQENLSNRVSYLDFFRNEPNRRRLAVLVAISLGQNWIGNGIISYYLSPILNTVGITDPTQIVGINGGLQIFNLVMALGASMCIERIGRRPLWLASTFGIMCSNACIMGLSAGFAINKTQALGVAVIPFLYIFYGFYDIAWTPLPYSYSSEILPFSMRTKGMAIFVATQNIGAAFNQFVNPIALQAIAWKYYGVYLIVEAAYLVFMWFYFPETKQKTIEEVSVIFDKYGKGGKAKDLQVNAMDQARAAGKDTAEHVEFSTGEGKKSTEQK
ncbi:unnamed protein product [Clonostachys byssicola]|uniref:Major facilitator superfamily (MFS) profile domain-containing protein n=1 Tax=Clonostachys byssicola TaxID=160290 RepID=A0A9N9UQC3_9HYPO|nr:unnamed protein product [Clonostachys byssicola]